MSDSELMPELYALQLEHWVDISMDALTLFEFITTFDQEVSSVWKRKWSGVSLLLFAVRYTMLATAIEDFAMFSQFNYRECVGYFITGDTLGLLGVLLTAMFSALRVYALCGGSVGLSFVTFLLQLSLVIANYDHIGNTYSIDSLLGCLRDDHLSLKVVEILIIASRIPLIIGDVLVVIITWMKSFNQIKMQRSLGMHFPFSTLLFRDGTVYFTILLILNILELSPLTSFEGGFVINALNGTIPLILVNRFMLNLRQLSNDETHSTSHIRAIKTPIFQMSVNITGNMGENLEHGWEAGTRGNDEAEFQDGRQGDELELHDVLHSDEVEIQEVLRGDEEAGPLGH